MTDDDLTPAAVVINTDDVVTVPRARKCAKDGCENIIRCGVGAPMFCAEEHDELNP